MQTSMEKIIKNGFINLGNRFLSHEEIVELVQESLSVFNQMHEIHPDYIPRKDGVEGIFRISQQSKKITKLINKVINNSEIKNLLSEMLGNDYKIWQINFRISKPGDEGLFLHQDALGELGLCILLSDNLTGDGATTFLKGSHLNPTRMKALNLIIPPIIINKLKFLFTPLTGEKGDVGFFFNRTWHGRINNLSDQEHAAILISFFPPGHTLSYKGYGDWSREYLDSIQGTVLGELIDPSKGTEGDLNEGYKIILNKQNKKIPLVYQIEDPEKFNLFPTFFQLMKIKILTKALLSLRVIYHWFK